MLLPCVLKLAAFLKNKVPEFTGDFVKNFVRSEVMCWFLLDLDNWKAGFPGFLDLDFKVVGF